VEAATTPSEDLGAHLDRIEAAVRAGDTDLRELGFWRLVALIKRDETLIDRYADQVGRIDTMAFEARFRIRVPVWFGNSLLVAVVAVGVYAAWIAFLAGPISSSEPYPPTAGKALVVAALAWMVGFHSTTHYVVGRLVGIRFRYYFAALPPPPLPGLKSDYATYLRTSPARRAWMHASGAIATKAAPFLALALAPASGAPLWAVLVLLGLGLFQIATDVLFSTKASDWKKVRRELALAREIRGTEQASVS
jgi:hypothetical protein